MNVYQAARARIARIFDEFDNVSISFSGGKDSGVMLNLCADYLRENPGRRMSVFHIDYEAQYEFTTRYVAQQLEAVRDVADIYHCCMPVSVPCSTSMHQAYWVPWDKEQRDIWVRDLPADSIHEDSHQFDFFTKGMRDYDFQSEFAEWLHRNKRATRTAVLVGIRTQESLNRWRALHADNNHEAYQGINWTRKVADGVYNAYPIFDWITEDVWTANAKNGYLYNRLYDVFYQAGVKLDSMRVASPFIEAGIDALKLYRVIEPNTWGKLVGRVNGVNFSGIYGGTTAMGWRSIKLPKGHTWKSYMEFLLETLPGQARENYKKKLEKSIQFWRERGGLLSLEVAEKLQDLGVSFTIGTGTNYKTQGKLPVRMEYLDDCSITEFSDIPTYKRMCVCIMKNDHLCKFMGFGLTKTENEIRREAERKFSKMKESKENQDEPRLQSDCRPYGEDQSEQLQPELCSAS